MLNRVSRAQDLHRAIKKHLKDAADGPDLALVHARFRPCDRREQEQTLHDVEQTPAAGRIVVATQAIEAGVDVSAATMFSELAPWPSLIQRFGRCNRRGECGRDGVPAARVYWIDLQTLDDNEKPLSKYALPYEPDELEQARKLLAPLADVGPRTLGKVSYTAPRRITHTLRRKDLLELWDTTPDLSGNDLDVSRYIRDEDDTDVQFYWRQWDGDAPAADDRLAPRREELCSVRIGQARDFLKKLAKKKVTGWNWDPLERNWRTAAADTVFPGQTILLPTAAGGYDRELGWTGDAKSHVEQLEPVAREEDGQELPANDRDRESEVGRWLTLAEHTGHVVSQVAELRDQLASEFPDVPWLVLHNAALWHDIGKSHESFQNMLLEGREDADPSAVWAKSPKVGPRTSYWVEKVVDTAVEGAEEAEESDETRAGKPTSESNKQPRRGFRHELASALAWLLHNNGEPQADLTAFLIAAHHGKVRMSIRSLPTETRPPEPARLFARGVWNGDRLPAVRLSDELEVPATELDLSLMQLGESETWGGSWLARTIALRDDPALGPFKLSFLETLLRAADQCASANEEGGLCND